MNSKIDPIPRKKLSDHIQERLLEVINSGDMRPGDVIPSERQLMEQFSVGRPAIREAMQNLQRMGLIEIRHGGRPRIAEPSFDIVMKQLAETMRHLLTHSSTSLEHLKEARVLFEVQMVRAAAIKRSDDDIVRLKDALERQYKAKSNHTEFLRRDGEFHNEIARISGNPIFEGLSASLFGWLLHFHMDLVSSPGLEELVLDEHSIILEAIVEGDADKAEEKISNHLYRANKLYQQLNKS